MDMLTTLLNGTNFKSIFETLNSFMRETSAELATINRKLDILLEERARKSA
jgi:hypothetical protein